MGLTAAGWQHLPICRVTLESDDTVLLDSLWCHVSQGILKRAFKETNGKVSTSLWSGRDVVQADGLYCWCEMYASALACSDECLFEKKTTLSKKKARGGTSLNRWVTCDTPALG